MCQTLKIYLKLLSCQTNLYWQKGNLKKKKIKNKKIKNNPRFLIWG